ncbi:hypothetical protein [uncultured Methanobrevibacter sp.]|uniref:hypothetical protein n=1 Tax=uncultured Methanobrevibacter sp. TaxID=253161 RepID=UPI0025E8E59B|nr:hypothetical protein [uncultured Methanobrevibacter sp.]
MIKEYPMTYGEFEKRVMELFVEQADSPSEKRKRKTLVREEAGVIKSEYDYACYCYDYQEERGPAAKNVFTDEGLLYQPVRILDMLY